MQLDALYAQVLKKLTGGVVALVLKRQDSHCRLLRTLARELLACAVLRPVLNFASPGYVCKRGFDALCQLIALPCAELDVNSSRHFCEYSRIFVLFCLI